MVRFQAFGLCAMAGAKYKQTHTPSCTQMQRSAHTHARARAHDNTQAGMGTGSSLICLLHMFPTRVKILPERDVKAKALTLVELNYLSDATFSSFNLTLTLIDACAPTRHRGVQAQRCAFGAKDIPLSVLILHPCFDAEQSSSTFHAAGKVLPDLVLMRRLS